MTEQVVVLSGVRSAIGTYKGTLSQIEPSELAGQVIKAAIERSGVEAGAIDYLTTGHCIPTDFHYPYLARVASINAGMSMDSVAMSVNRLCSSGLQSILTSAQAIMLGDYDYAIGGGVEVMSRGGYLSPAMRSGAGMGNTTVYDMMLSVITDPFGVGHMGITAENVADKWGISREEQDAFAAESHRRAALAMAEGRFTSQITPVTIKGRKADIIFDTDEHVKPETTAASLARLRPAFKEGGTVTAGNASGINDGAAYLVMASASAAEKAGHKPMARLVSYGLAGVSNHIMGEGPIPASLKALKNAGLSVQDMDVIESNEAFAAQALAVSKGLGLDPAKTNPNGGAIALGHPVGASGACITVKALYELERINGRYALVTLCIGGGQGLALIFERL